jgi:hypothetical protein
MSEEMLSEFIRELSERDEPIPDDLVKKYIALGVPEGEIAAVLLARSALSGPEVPASAMESSERRIEELVRQAAAKPARSGEAPGLKGKVRKLFRKE